MVGLIFTAFGEDLVHCVMVHRTEEKHPNAGRAADGGGDRQ